MIGTRLLMDLKSYFPNFSFKSFLIFSFLLKASFIFCSDNDILIFYHIPKTAGTTINFLLKKQFSKEEICPDRYYFQVEQRTNENLNKFKFFSGHFFFNSNLKELTNAKRIVFMRDPIERVLSEQRFLEYHEQMGEGVGNFLYKEHYLPKGQQPIDSLSNHQCLFLSSYDRDDPFVTAEMHLESAKVNLRDCFFFIGITENMNESMHDLYRLMGWEPPAHIPRYNTTDSIHLDVDRAVIEQIRSRNLQDIELYEYAKSISKSKLRFKKKKKIYVDKSSNESSG